MKRRTVRIIFFMAILTAVILSSCAAPANEKQPVYEDDEVKYYVKEALTDGFHILVRIEIEEKTPVIKWEYLAGFCKINVLSGEMDLRSRVKHGPYARISNPEERTFDIYFTAFTTAPFTSIRFLDFWINSRRIPDGLELFPERIGTEFTLPPAEEHFEDEYYATGFTISELGFYCDIRYWKDWVVGEPRGGNNIPVELHYADGKIVEVQADCFPSGFPDANSYVIDARFTDYPDINPDDYESIVKVVIGSIECVKP